MSGYFSALCHSHGESLLWWKGWPSEDDQCVIDHDAHAPSLIRKFQQNQKSGLRKSVNSELPR
jgi:hypothetical protein